MPESTSSRSATTTTPPQLMAHFLESMIVTPLSRDEYRRCLHKFLPHLLSASGRLDDSFIRGALAFRRGLQQHGYRAGTSARELSIWRSLALWLMKRDLLPAAILARI